MTPPEDRLSQFRLENIKMAAVTLQGDSIRAVTGAMVAYEGQVAFKNAGMGGGEGLGAAFKRKLSGESLSFMECSGQGVVYLAVNASEISLIQLQGHTLSVEASSLLALEGGLRTDVKFTGLRGMSTGQGLATTTVTGNGVVAIMSDGPAIMLEVSPQYPVVVDPQAYVASIGQLNQSFVTDISWRNFVGGGSGEAFSLRFEGQGVVYIQPAER
jgi:uncharacterized protein (AIM24 family)